MKNLSDNMLFKQVIAPQAIGAAGSVDGTGIDCAGYEQLTVVADVGAVVNAANKTITVKLQESSDNGSVDAFADVTGATTGAVANAGQNKPYIIDVNLSERERYLRVNATGGSADGALVGVMFILSRGRHEPPTQDKTVISV